MRRLLAGLCCLLAVALVGCNDTEPKFQGWIEANLIFVGPDEAGRVDTLSVREGDKVDAKAPLFTLDDDLQRADLALNEAALKNAEQAFDRAKKLLTTQAGTQKTYDDAEAALRTAQARLNASQTRLARRKVASPVSGTVPQVYVRPGEMVSAGRPVLSLVPPGNMKVRFFVPEGMLPQIAHGDAVSVHCDGCPGEIKARVSFIAKSAEFTPPVIYSQTERAKLVFLIEALPDNPESLRVGQPVDVTIAPKPANPKEAAR